MHAADRPEGRRRDRHHLHQRPHARLRARELGVHLMTDAAPLETLDPRAPTPRPRPAPSSRACRGSSGSPARSSSSSSAATPWSTTTLQRAFAEDMVYLRHVGIKPVVVHGGGPQISAMLERLGIASQFVGGYRVTTPETMDVVRMVLTGQVSRELVSLINEHGPLASAISGEDAGLFRGTPARRRRRRRDGRHRPGRRRGRGGSGRGARRGRRRAHPGGLLDRPRHRRAGPVAQRERRLGRRVARRRARRREARRAHRCRGPLPRLAGPRLAGVGHRHRRAHRPAAAASRAA